MKKDLQTNTGDKRHGTDQPAQKTTKHKDDTGRQGKRDSKKKVSRHPTTEVNPEG